MDEYIFTKSNVEESLSIMREAAQWLINKGCPLWNLDDLTSEKMKNEDDEYIVMWDKKGQSIATLLLNFEDRLFWSDIPPNTSGFIHKVSIRREYAGKGLAKHIIDYAIQECKQKGIESIRLDCDSERRNLCDFYTSIGFYLKEVKTLKTKRGEFSVALYEMNF
jgi:GNAT superfamily N-acetyltransferase